MKPFDSFYDSMLRRTFLKRSAGGIGMMALASLLGRDLGAAETVSGGGLPGLPHYLPKAKRVIFMHMAGAPSHIDLFEHKPQLDKLRGTDLPASVRNGQRITGFTSGQKTLPIAPAHWPFKMCGPSAMPISDLLPELQKIAGDLAFVRSMHTDAINHDPGMSFLQSGSQLPGRPALGSWLSYGLGSVNLDLPAFVVLVSRGAGRPQESPVYDRFWASGFLPGEHQGTRFRAGNEPVPFLASPNGVAATDRRDQLDDLVALNRRHEAALRDSEIAARISQYELAFRMQTSVPELLDLSKEPKEVFDLYGPAAQKPGSFAWNCLMARRLAERGVRTIQLSHVGWDHHENVVDQLPRQCAEADRPTAALITDLKRRGLLDDTLVVWGGEFGRTIFTQGGNNGRDHHPRCFTIWMAGGGIKPGTVVGETDDFAYNVVRDPCSVHDLHATILDRMGINHEKLTYLFQGRQFRLTDVSGVPIGGVMA
ncbi:MAG: DUF1501 domain-containing protein [Chthoniobacter sp.]|nr:DUF1501 domain-containing protein [Chthoniobacter sp.]